MLKINLLIDCNELFGRVFDTGEYVLHHEVMSLRWIGVYVLHHEVMSLRWIGAYVLHHEVMSLLRILLFFSE